MSKIIITHEPVSLINGSYPILKKHLIIQLDEIRKEELQYEKDKLINSCQYAVTSAPWKQLRGDDYIVEFKWFEGKEPEIVDSKYQILYDISTKEIGSKVKLIYSQKGYTNHVQKTIGTRLILKGIQVIEFNNPIKDPWLIE